jgi:hypothetical protein
LIKKDGEGETALIDAVDKLLGLALVCSPLVAGPSLVAILPTLAVKNELVKLGKDVFSRLTAKDDEDYAVRHERMEMAYGLIIFTSFFDALDSQLPKALREKIGSLDPHKAFLVKEAARKGRKSDTFTTVLDPADAPAANIRFAFPHPTESLTDQIERHQDLWKQMAQGFGEFVQRLAFWEEEGEKDQAQIISAIQKVREQVPRFFEAQYFSLAKMFEDFAIWANLHEHAKTKQLLRNLSTYVQEHIKLSQAAEKSIDIGFSKLHSLVLDMPETLKLSQAKEVVDGLAKYYKARVGDPIIEDKEELEPSKPRLIFPRICDAFIPQAFRVLRQSGKGRRLEDEETWEDLPRRNDLGVFLLSYLSSPYSTEAPLLILGHPGSGKSLLTTVLASQLMSKHFTAIRVPLREVNAEAGIVSQIEETIRRITNVSQDSWAKVSGAFKNNPPLVVLDGYDELLQASGKVFAGYLKDVQHFQRNEAEQGRPVRVIVTSRVTLIDKATVPAGSTIIRLLEFDEAQRERWISIWNKTNLNYFRDAKVDEFVLPDKKEGGAEKILALAEQPLLLLMLALYDSQENQLRKSKSLDRTKLYDSLLRRFVTRERGKDKGFDDSKPIEKKRALDSEMQRLGVAALGMYNRRKVHILATELNDDLKFFDLERFVNVTDGRALSQADLLLGSFFFIHKSKAQHAAGAPETHEETSAFEFLHNTFGEFLTADFILQRTLAEVEALQALQNSEALHAALEKMLSDADGFQREWFASLVYTPLFTRPVVMEMMREWIRTVLADRKISPEDFLATLQTIVLNQIKRLLNKREMPSIICKDTAQEGYHALFGDHPLLGHVAIYSMNLILLRALTSDKPFVFDEAEIDTHEDGARPWDRLINVWRSWFSLDNLNGITAVMTATRDQNQITVSAKERFQVAESQNRLQTCLNVGISLADNISSGLTGLLLFDPVRENLLTIGEIEERLVSEKLDLHFEISLKRLTQIAGRIDDDTVDLFCHEARAAFEQAMHEERDQELEQIAVCLRRAVYRLSVERFASRSISLKFDVVRKVLEPTMSAEIAVRNPQAGIVLWEIAKQTGNAEWKHRFARGFFEFGFRQHHPMDMIRQPPETWAAWLQLARELSVDQYFGPFRDKFWPEYFERVLDPRYFAEIGHANPAAALNWLKLAREFGGERFFRYFDREILHRLFRSSDLFELSNHYPELLLGWLELAVEGGVDRFVNQIEPKLLQRLWDPEFISNLVDRDPETAISWIRVTRSLNGKHFMRKGWKILDHLFDPRRYGIDLMELKPEVALALINVAREIGLEELPHLKHDVFERFVHPRRLLELSHRNPDLALTWLQLVGEAGTVKFLRKVGDELFEEGFDSFVLRRFLRSNPIGFAFALQLARVTQSRRGLETVVDSLSAISKIELGLLMNGLPISAVPEIHWLIENAEQTEPIKELAALLSRSLVKPVS